MSDVLESIDVWLTDPSSTVVPVGDVSWKSSVNGGVQWSAKLHSLRPVTWGDVDEWRLHVRSRAGLFADWDSPPLVALAPDRESFGGEGTMQLAGTDKTSYLLTAEGLTMPYFRDAMANTVISAIGTKAGITVRFLGSTVLSTMRLQWFFVQGAQETLGSHICNILGKAACNYRIGADGAFEIFQMNRDVAYSGLVLGRGQYSPRLGNKFSQIVAQKYSAQQTEFRFTSDQAADAIGGDVGPVGLLGSTITAVDASSSGVAWFAAFYSGPSGGGSLVALFQLDPTEFESGGLGSTISFPPADGSLTAMSVVWGAKATAGVTTVNAGLLVHGQPPSDHDYHASFKAKYPDIDTASRQRKKLYASPLWPTLDFVTSNSLHQQMLWEANKSSEGVRREARFDPNTLPGGTLPEDADAPKARFDTVEWSIAGNDIKMNLSGFAVPW